MYVRTNTQKYGRVAETNAFEAMFRVVRCLTPRIGSSEKRSGSAPFPAWNDPQPLFMGFLFRGFLLNFLV